MKSKTKTESLYKPQIEGAAANITGAYNAAKPGLEAGAGQFQGLLDSVMKRYNDGDPALEAAKGYTTDVIGGKYLDAGNPYLQGMIDLAGNDTRNQVSAGLGARGLTGGSAHSDIMSRAIADKSLGMRYADYGAERDRMGQAVSQVPGLIAGESAMLAPAFDAYDAMQAPLRAAVGAGSGVGGLLGQYTKTTQKGSIAQLLAQMAGNAAQAYAGGG